MKINKAEITVHDSIIKLLADNHLPVEDVDFTAMQFYTCKESERLIATAAVQPAGKSLLLRSVAVDDDYKGQGVGSRLVKQVLSEHPGKPVFLLTEHASTFFEQLGFKVHDREKVPLAIRRSSQFSRICPASVTCMKKS